MPVDQPAPLTLEEHRDLGDELRRMHARLRELARLITAVYGPGHQAAYDFRRTTESLQRLCCDMEMQAQADWPGLQATGIYT